MAFLNHILCNQSLQTVFSEEIDLWNTVEESAAIISLQGMEEDRHLCLLIKGWRGLLNFSGEKLLRDSAEQTCTDYVACLEDALRAPGSKVDENASLLNSTLIYLFPTVA